MQTTAMPTIIEVRTVARSYYSVVLDYPADDVWAAIRPFDQYAWAGVESETILEDNKAADQVGAVRRIKSGGEIRRQILLAHSDIDRSYTYAFAGAAPFPVRDFTATIRVVAVVAGTVRLSNGRRRSTAPKMSATMGPALREQGLCHMARLTRAFHGERRPIGERQASRVGRAAAA